MNEQIFVKPAHAGTEIYNPFANAHFAERGEWVPETPHIADLLAKGWLTVCQPPTKTKEITNDNRI